MLEKMQEQDEFPNRSTLDEVNEIDGADEEFRPATNDMFEMKERKYIHLYCFGESENYRLFNSLEYVCYVADSLFDDYRLSTINKLPTWAKKQVSLVGILSN
jgi:hypothetical protein